LLAHPKRQGVANKRKYGLHLGVGLEMNATDKNLLTHQKRQGVAGKNKHITWQTKKTKIQFCWQIANKQLRFHDC
jgi:hypothetical protein